MSIASLSFTASLPTYDSVGANGTVFSNNTLAASGSVLVNTNSSTTGQPSVLAANLSANGLSYNFQSFSLSGDTLSVIYGLPSSATTAQQNEASDENTALSNGLPGNVTNFSSTGSVTEGNGGSTLYNVATAGVVAQTPANNQGSALSTTSSGDGTNLSIQSITTGPGNTLDVTFNVTEPTSAAAASSSATPTTKTDTNTASTFNSGSAFASVLAGLPQSNGTAGLNTQNSDSSSSLNPGSLLADLLNQQASQSAGIYNLVAGFSTASNSSSSTSTNFFA